MIYDARWKALLLLVLRKALGGLQRALHFAAELEGKKKTALTAAAGNRAALCSFAERRDVETSHQVA